MTDDYDDVVIDLTLAILDMDYVRLCTQLQKFKDACRSRGAKNTNKKTPGYAVSNGDMRDMLHALGIGDRVSTVATNRLMQDEILPAIRQVVADRDEAITLLREAPWLSEPLTSCARYNNFLSRFKENTP